MPRFFVVYWPTSEVCETSEVSEEIARPCPRRSSFASPGPTPTAILHVGHLAGAYLPADIFARYHRLAGNQVLMVSGSDTHGTPITVRADAEGVTAAEVFRALPRALPGDLAAAGHQLRPVHPHRHREPPPRDAGHLPAPARTTATSTRTGRASSTPKTKAASWPTATWRAPARLRLRRRARRPVRQLRQAAGRHRTDQPAQQDRRHARR